MTQYLSVLHEYRNVFTEPVDPILGIEEMSIRLKSDVEPFSTVPYRMSALELKELKTILNDWSRRGWIRVSKDGSWASPCLIVPKPGGKGYRLVIDFRALNQSSLNDSFPLPRIDTILSSLSTSKVFSKMDLLHGYHQLRLAPASQPLTAFCSEAGLFEWTRVPQGLKQSPGYFSRAMQTLFAPLLAQGFLVLYLDDLLLHTASHESHLSALRQLLVNCNKHNLWLSPSKCLFGASKVEFLGHTITSSGVLPGTARTEAISVWPLPTTRSDLVKFCGILNWFRDQLPQFAKYHMVLQTMINESDEKEPLVWTDKATQCFEHLKHLMVSATALTQFLPGMETCLWVDASDYAYGGALLQLQDGLWRPIAFHSKRFTVPELKFTVREKELVAMTDCITKWRHYILGIHFTCYTDHEALLQKSTSRIKQSRFLRIQDTLSEYTYTIEHKAGISNTLADALSRRPDHYKWFTEFQKTQYGSRTESIGVQIDYQVNHVVLTPARRKRVTFAKTLVQYYDPSRPAPLRVTYDSGCLVSIVSSHCLPVHSLSLPATFLERLQQSYAAQPLSLLTKLAFLKRGADQLYRTPANQLWIPDADLQNELTTFIHSKLLYHSGTAKTLQQLKRIAWWRNQINTVRACLRGCQSCQASKNVRKQTPKLRKLVASKPFEALQIDFIWGLPPVTRSHYCGILTIIDVYSKLCRLIPVPVNITAEKTAELIYSHWCTHYGLPAKIHSDQDVRFTGSLWSNLLAQANISAELSTPYYPEANGLVERLNQTAVSRIRAWLADTGNYLKWHECLPAISFSINNSVHRSTGVSPHQLAFGQQLDMLPLSDLSSAPLLDSTQLASLKQTIQAAYDQAQADVTEAPNPWVPTVGSQVWLSSKKLRWKRSAHGKLLPAFTGPFKVIEVKPSGKAATLELPPAFRCRRTWNTRYLKPWCPSTLGLAPPVSDWTPELYDLLDPQQDISDLEENTMQVDSPSAFDSSLQPSPRPPVQPTDPTSGYNLRERPERPPIQPPAKRVRSHALPDLVDDHLDMFEDNLVLAKLLYTASY